MTRNFTGLELMCKCGCRVLPRIFAAEQLQKLRDVCGFVLSINSGMRCEKHNAAIGGAKASTHMKGIAFDIGWVKMTGEQKHKLLSEACKLFNGIGISEQFLHVDMRPVPIIFFYPK